MLVFKEKQKFTQWWLWLLLICIGIGPFVGIYTQLIKKESFGDSSMFNSISLIYIIIILSVVILLLVLTLKTEITSKGIQMNYFPFVKKEITWQDIKTAKVVNYGFVGGWGIR